MAKKTSKSIDDGSIVDEITGLSRTFTSLLVKNINNDKRKNIERIVNNDPRNTKKVQNPKKEMMNDLNLC